jgi:predicted nucleic acid-binding protein
VSAPTVIVDTGPLVALLNRRERHHAWVELLLRDQAPPLLTCEAVLAEAAFLLRRIDPGARALMTLLERGAVRLAFRLDEHHEQVARLMTKYASVPMSLADACLVRMTETSSRVTVMTFDADFHVYRRNGRQVVPTTMPPPQHK